MTTRNSDTERTRHRLNTLYDSAASKAHRADKESRGKPDPLRDMRLRHREDRAEVGERYRVRGRELQKQFNRDRANDRQIRNGGPPTEEILRREKAALDDHNRERDGEMRRLKERHEREESAFLQRHSTA
jgi:hypothetical protein